MQQPHYLRVVRALALAAIASGCGTASDPSPEGEPLATERDAGTEAVVADAGATHDPETEVDAEVPFSSGPIVPPELPADFS